MIYDCIIVGAGPAGLMAGCFVNKGKNLILEGENKPAQKLLLSGGGQCNFTHDGNIREFFDRFGGQGKFVRKALSAFTNEDVKTFFEKNGVRPLTREDGKVFPDSLDAWDIFRVLRDCATSRGCEILTGKKVRSVTKSGLKAGESGALDKAGFTGELFKVVTDEEVFLAKTLILATGGGSYPMTGSDGSGVLLAGQLGHETTKLQPALTPVYIEGFKLADLAGISFKDGELAHYRAGKKIGTYFGDVLITHTGLSGPGILDKSRYICAGDDLYLKMAYKEAQRNDVEKALLEGNKKQVSTVLAEFMTKRVAQTLTRLAGIDQDKTCAELAKQDRKTLLNFASGYPVKVSKLGSMKSAMVTSGGVSLKGVTAGTMASKLVEGLFFAGEVLDVDGDSGGYNIQWAFSSGRLAALSAMKYIEEKQHTG